MASTTHPVKPVLKELCHVWQPKWCCHYYLSLNFEKIKNPLLQPVGVKIKILCLWAVRETRTLELEHFTFLICTYGNRDEPNISMLYLHNWWQVFDNPLYKGYMLLLITFFTRHWSQVRGPGRCGNPHHLWSSGSHVCLRGAGWIPVCAAAGVRRPAGPQHRSHPPQQQHQRHGLWQAGRHRHPGHPHRAHALLCSLQHSALRPLRALLHPGHPLHYQHGAASAHAAYGLPLGEAVPQPMLCQDPPEDG